MGGVVLIVVMALPLEAALVLLWFGPLRSEDTRPPGQSSFWRFRPQNPEHEISVDVTARDDLYASNKKPGETGRSCSTRDPMWSSRGSIFWAISANFAEVRFTSSFL
ncbi:hypothetical protein CDO28_21835 (plasmid) [Sinorhizobium meliloti]|nr:hypothetical protein CDO28_21835 [Sinorhizobium meliloti]